MPSLEPAFIRQISKFKVIFFSLGDSHLIVYNANTSYILVSFSQGEKMILCLLPQVSQGVIKHT